MNRPVRRADSRPERIKVSRQELVVARGRLEKARYLNPFNPAIEGGGEVPKLEANLASVRYSQARKESLAPDRDRQNA